MLPTVVRAPGPGNPERHINLGDPRLCFSVSGPRFRCGCKVLFSRKRRVAGDNSAGDSDKNRDSLDNSVENRDR